MAQCYLFDVLPPCCVFPILPETFFHPSPPYHPFVSTPRSPFFSPSSLDTSNNRGATSWPTRIFEDPCEAFGRHMFSGGAPLYRIAYVGIVDDNQRPGKKGRIFSSDILERFCSIELFADLCVILISSDIFYRQSHRSMSCANKRMSNRRV